MATHLSRSAWAKFSVFRKKIAFFSLKTYSYRIFKFNFEKQRLRIDPCTHFQPDWAKDKGARISIRKDTENCLMTSYLPHRDDVSKTFMAFERFCPSVLPCQIWWQLNHKHCPAQPRGGGRLPNRRRYGCAGPGIRCFRGQFLPGYKVLGGKFCPSIRFLVIFDKTCDI